MFLNQDMIIKKMKILVDYKMVYKRLVDFKKMKVFNLEYHRIW
jgi:hypothetical protein